MNGAAKLYLAFDIDDLAGTERDARGDPVGPAETKIPDLKHCKPIDLSDCLAFGVDRDGIAQDFLLHAVTKTAPTPHAACDRLLDRCQIDHIGAGFLSPEVSLPHDVRKQPDPRGELLTIACFARAFLDDARDGSVV